MAVASPVSAPRPPRGFSLFQKLLALILLLVSSVVLVLAGYLPSRQIASMRTALDAKTLTYARLVSKQVAPAVAFDDQETAREVFDSLFEDPDVESLTLLSASGAILSSRGAPTRELVERRTPASTTELHAGPARVSAVTPVISLEGPRGTLVVELSERRLSEQRALVRRNALAVGLLALLLGAVGAALIAVSIARRLRAIGRVAEAVAGGDLDQPAVDVTTRSDEIGVVALAFNAMLTHIRELVAQIRKSAQDEQHRLEGLVAERTRDLDRRNEDLKRVLDNVGQGFVALDREGNLSRERSRVLAEWFPDGATAESFGDLLATADPALRAWFALGWESVKEGLMPLEVSIDQLPHRITAAGRELGLEYRPILTQAGELERLLVVVSDLTDAIRRARAEADEREVTGLLSRLIADRPGFLEFFAEAQALVERIDEAIHGRDEVLLKRAVHTLKGNASLYGLGTMAELCHRLEENLAEGGRLDDEDIAPLRARWLEISAKVQSFAEDRSDRIELDDAEYAAMLTAIERGVPHAELHRRAQAWRLEPARTRLARIADQAVALAERLGKAPIEVDIVSNDVRVEREEWGEFWSACVHVIRNAVDHGLETPEEREELGKSVPARLRLSTAVTASRFQVEFSDDGRGIDWEAARAAARARGLAAETPADLTAALLTDGLSTRQEATEYSGRGVGLAAVREACAKLGGSVEIESKPGQGTTFRFIWPASVAYVPARLPSVFPARRAPSAVSRVRVGT